MAAPRELPTPVPPGTRTYFEETLGRGWYARRFRQGDRWVELVSSRHDPDLVTALERVFEPEPVPVRRVSVDIFGDRIIRLRYSCVDLLFVRNPPGQPTGTIDVVGCTTIFRLNDFHPQTYRRDLALVALRELLARHGVPAGWAA